VSFNEQAASTPQTGWVPVVNFGRQHNAQGRPIVDDTTLYALDGAGPVVWRVVKYMHYNVQNDRSRDTVIVTFSEPVLRHAGYVDLQQNDLPADMFYVWNGDTTVNSTMLVGITNQYNVPTSTVVTFLMSNGADLNGTNMLNFRDSGSMYVVDLRHNQPNDNNQLVPVEVIGQPNPAVSAPNPGTGYVGHPGHEAGIFRIEDIGHIALDMADPNQGGGGVAVKFDFQNPEPGVGVQCQVKIYDMVGNVVQWGRQDDFLSTVQGRSDQAAATGLLSVYLYWNGTNMKGMKVAPGVYRMVIYLHYVVPSSAAVTRQYKDEKRLTKIGIKSF
jgi:hypothetical protein